jgi:hypothetical protein
MRGSRIQVLTLALAVLAGVATAHAQTLAVQGDHFAVNGQGRFLLFVSYFDAMHASARALDIDFQYLREKGFDGIRIFPNWAQGCGARVTATGFYTATGVVPASDPLWIKFIDILDRARNKGLLVDVTLDARTPGAQAAAPAIAERLAGGYRHVLFDVYNEWDTHISPPDANRTLVKNLVAAVHEKDAARITTGSASLPSLGSIAATDRYDVVAYHDARSPASWFSQDAILGQLNAIRASLGPSVKPIYLQEPMPFANYDGRPVSAGGCGDQQHDSAQGHARLAAQFAKRHGAAAWTFHTRQSFSLGSSSLKDILSLPAHASQKAELEAVRSAVDAPGVTWGVTAPVRSPRAGFDGDF